MDDIPYGYCQCGCGEKTKIAPHNDPRTNPPTIKGEPFRFLFGHHACRLQPTYTAEDRGYITECWIWQGARTVRGYGLAKRSDGKRGLAHRYYYESANGPIKAGLLLHHRCEVKSCVNPEHLEPLTQPEHMRLHKQKHDAKKFCKAGHPLKGSNIFVKSAGKGSEIACRMCRRKYSRDRKRKCGSTPGLETCTVCRELVALDGEMIRSAYLWRPDVPLEKWLCTSCADECKRLFRMSAVVADHLDLSA